MNAGRELDAQIFRSLFGNIPLRVDKDGVIFTSEREYLDIGDAYYINDIGGAERVPEYSTEIADAFLIVEKTKIFNLDHYNDEKWSAGIAIGESKVRGAEAETAPLAICLAALKAVGVKVE